MSALPEWRQTGKNTDSQHHPVCGEMTAMAGGAPHIQMEVWHHLIREGSSCVSAVQKLY